MRPIWVPKQHGVWAMMIAPALTGGIVAGFAFYHVILLVAWVSAYLAFMAVRGWLRPRQRARYVRPLALWASLCLVALAGLLIWRPALVWWAIPLIVLLGASQVLIATGHERTVPNDALLIAASCLMATIATGGASLTDASWATFLHSISNPESWLVTAIFAAYFWGTIFYVKTMIRERGKLSWRIASVVYHLVWLVPAFLVNPWTGVFALLLAARAILVPLVWPRTKPVYIGLGEVGLTVVLILIICVTLSLG